MESIILSVTALANPASWLACLGNFHCKVTRRPPRCKGFQEIFLFYCIKKRVFPEPSLALGG